MNSFLPNLSLFPLILSSSAAGSNPISSAFDDGEKDKGCKHFMISSPPPTMEEAEIGQPLAVVERRMKKMGTSQSSHPSQHT